MAKAVWKNTILAESDTFETLEGNIYFPADAFRREYPRPYRILARHRSNPLSDTAILTDRRKGQ